MNEKSDHTEEKDVVAILHAYVGTQHDFKEPERQMHAFMAIPRRDGILNG